MPGLVTRVAETIERHALCAPGDRVVVGVSGGADSLALLHALLALRERLGIALHVATLDHGLRGAAGAADADFVRSTALDWGLPVTVGRADAGQIARSRRLSVEEAARQVRYTFLLRVARQVGAARVAVGHQRDDQAETVLMHLLRGSGLSGLRGMLPATPLSDYHLLEDAIIACDPPLDGLPATPDAWPVLIRPLLDLSRREIDEYIAAQGLTARLDATNQDTAYFRNRLRHEVLPLLETLNPNVREVLARTADVLRADAELVRAAGEAALARALRGEAADSIVLDRAVWDDLPLSSKRHLIRAAVWRLRPALRDVTFEHVERALAVSASGHVGVQATLPGGLALRVGYDVLVFSGAGADPVEVGADAPALPGERAGPAFNPGERVEIACGAWVFSARPLLPDDDLPALHADPLAAALAVPAGARLWLRARRPGDRFRPRGMGGRSQKLADTLINLRVPAGWRDRVPLLVVDDAIAWFVAPTAGGLRARVAEPFAVPGDLAQMAGVGVVVCWRRAE
ncbi:MAG: tRNA lysidine(34) synthetase TilS [Anaerolineae bacterium]|nr:tRNA lysidine(34) synthetase TilS [Anaerolineae bacterium]